MRRMAWALVALVVMAAWGRGGAGKYSSPTATFKTLQAAIRANNRKAVLACFTVDEGKRPVGHEEITQELPELIRRARKVEMGKEEIADDTATLEYRLDGSEQLPLAFTREDGGWKINRYVPLQRAAGKSGPGPDRGTGRRFREQDIGVKDLPAAVVATIQKEAPGRQAGRAGRLITTEGKTFYDVALTGEGRSNVVTDAEGNLRWKVIEEKLAMGDLPAEVRSALQKEAGGRKVEGIAKATLTDMTLYAARVVLGAGKRDARILVNEDGTLCPNPERFVMRKKMEALPELFGP